MPQFLRVPWIRWQRFRIAGEMRRPGDGRPGLGQRDPLVDPPYAVRNNASPGKYFEIEIRAGAGSD